MKGTGEFYVVCTEHGQYFFPFTEEGYKAAEKQSRNFRITTFVVDTMNDEDNTVTAFGRTN